MGGNQVGHYTIPCRPFPLSRHVSLKEDHLLCVRNAIEKLGKESVSVSGRRAPSRAIGGHTVHPISPARILMLRVIVEVAATSPIRDSAASKDRNPASSLLRGGLALDWGDEVPFGVLAPALPYPPAESAPGGPSKPPRPARALQLCTIHRGRSPYYRILIRSNSTGLGGYRFTGLLVPFHRAGGTVSPM